ncbi:MAG: hypothetical protein COA46_10685 [Porticoccaceae bacterium]|nr:MAG: hypothetical protein COA46_10685 [Porticoccaceae bacterium]
MFKAYGILVAIGGVISTIATILGIGAELWLLEYRLPASIFCIIGGIGMYYCGVYQTQKSALAAKYKSIGWGIFLTVGVVGMYLFETGAPKNI